MSSLKWQQFYMTFTRTASGKVAAREKNTVTVDVYVYHIFLWSIAVFPYLFNSLRPSDAYLFK